jgi:hypothetical protein
MLQAVRSPVLILDEVNGFISWASPSSSTIALALTPAIREMSTRNLPGGKRAAGMKY